MYEPDDLRNAGLRVTVPRIKILEILRTTHIRHLSAEDIRRQLIKQQTEITLPTVTRVLAQLESAGLVVCNSFLPGKPLYELNEKTQHDHLVCSHCGHIHEFKDLAIQRYYEATAQSMEFKLERYQLVIYGLCLDCAHSNMSKRTPP